MRELIVAEFITLDGVIQAPGGAEEERVDVLHQREEVRADVVVPVGDGPSAVLEPAITIFILAARRLNDSVQRYELGHDQLSHRPFQLRDLVHTNTRSGMDRQSHATMCVSIRCLR